MLNFSKNIYGHSKQYYRRIEGKRLAYYKNSADPNFWDHHWHENFKEKIYKDAEQGKLNIYKKYFLKYLPKDNCIIEAGCGLGQYVLALRSRGYNVEGVEWAPDTVSFVLNRYPDLPIRLGNVTNLEIPDEYYGGCISLGVVEHSRKGPGPFLTEIYRFLKPGGVALIAVPVFNLLRKLKARFGFYQDNSEGFEFYQYAFKKDEFISLLENAGLKVVDYLPIGGYKGIIDEIPVLRWLAQWRPFRICLQLILIPKLFRLFCGHASLFVCRKT